MRNFLVRIIIFSGIPIIICFIFFFRPDGYTDPFYLRFTSTTQTSLIIGTSRAAQGLVPSVFNKVLQRRDIYNYSFSVVHSSYGPVYFESIKNKINKGSKNGIFILAVDPWSISNASDNPNDSLNFPELKLALGKTKFVNLNPNLFYLLQSYDKPFWHLFKRDTNTGMLLHNDGWLEVTVPMDSTSLAIRIDEKVLDYKKNNLPRYKYSELRWIYLIKTINFLKVHGKVFLVRIPVHKRIFEIENIMMPMFENKIDELSKVLNIDYLSLSDMNEKLEYVDGNHLYKKSAEIVSFKVAQWIKNKNKKIDE